MAEKKKALIKPSKNEVRVNIIKSTPSNFFLNSVETNPEDIHEKDLEFNLKLKLSSSETENKIRVNLTLIATLKEDADRELFGITSESDFEVLELESMKPDIPQEFTRKLLNISIGGLRGMLAVYLLNTKFNHVTIPLFDLGKIK